MKTTLISATVNDRLGEVQPVQREVVKCDFTQLDEVRRAVRLIVNMIPNNPFRSKGKKGRLSSYNYTRFYIGRGVTNLKFYGIFVSEFQMNKVQLELRRVFPNLNFHVDGRNMTVYTRGERRR